MKAIWQFVNRDTKKIVGKLTIDGDWSDEGYRNALVDLVEHYSKQPYLVVDFPYEENSDSSNQEERGDMKTIEITDELYECLKDLRHADGAEAWYTAQIEIDLNDMDATIKDIIISRDMWMTADDEELTSNKTYPWDSHSSEQSTRAAHRIILPNEESKKLMDKWQKGVKQEDE